MTISVVIPTLDEASCIVRSVESVVAPGIEVIVVDGGSRDETCRLARDAGARVFASQRGRAR
ncbi:MAG: glycosyltransferase, partial [Myxococcota bacterium]